MAIEVPTMNAAKDAGMTGLKAGGIGGLGTTLGQSILGPGLGTAAGGVLAASSMSGNARDTVATVSVMQATNELMGGGGTSQQSGGRRRM